MDKENNTNLGGNSDNRNTETTKPTSESSSSPGRINYTDTSASVANAPTGIQPSAPKPVTSSKKPKKFGSKLFVVIVLFILSLGAASAAGYYVGNGNNENEVAQPVVATAKKIDLPPEAIVTAECVPGRGKQYIIPKDIPKGPIYNVNGDRVIAIEYTIGIGELLYSQSTEFSDIILKLAKDYPVDHFSVIPKQSASQNPRDQQVHLIMFIVPKEEAASITCGIDPAVLKQQAEEAQKAIQAQQPQ